MLTLLTIKNIALIDQLELEFGPGLNLLTGETGSGKSIIVDSLGALIGARVSNDIIKEGEASAQIEGLFIVTDTPAIRSMLDESGVEIEDGQNIEMIVRRELSQSGKNRVFVNNQLVTQGFLKKLGALLAAIHGQGEQTELYNVETHIGMLDEFAAVDNTKGKTKEAFREWSAIRGELLSLEKDEAEKLQLLDILRFQVGEITAASLVSGEDDELEGEKRRLNNVEKLSSLSEDVFSQLYENDGSTLSTLEKAARKIAELAEFDARFREYDEGLRSAQAVIEELAITARDFRSSLEFSPDRLNEIETRLAEMTRLKRKYGGSIDTALEHLRISNERLENIQNSELREKELKRQLENARIVYLKAAGELHKKRAEAGAIFSNTVENDLKAVALEKARFEVRVEAPADADDSGSFSAGGFDHVEFYFSANPGESPKPLAKTASGGEASRLMLILKTAAKTREAGKTSVFDEIDIGIGGRVAEAVGRKLKELSESNQVFCVTHQPQIASLADRHFVVEKNVAGSRTTISVRKLSENAQIEELARMLAGSEITEAARENARVMLASGR